MFLRACQFSRTIGTSFEEIRTASPWILGSNHTSKRYAGHSQYANRKDTKLASSRKLGELKKKYQWEMQREVQFSKNANLETNNKLKAIFGEAMKNNVPKASLENILKALQATLGRGHINTFVYSNPLGILGVIEISSIHTEHAKSQATSAVKKFGFQIVNNQEASVGTVGIVTCKQLENVENPIDKAVEDAITVNCEEVKEADDNCVEFQCHPNQLDSCVKSLTELGYKIVHSESRYVFTELAKIENEVVLDKLQKMEERLELVPGFVRICYNME